MGKHKLILIMLLAVLCLAGCSNPKDEEYKQISFTEHDFSDVDNVIITNAHNGNYTYVTDKDDIESISNFIKNLSGTDGISSKGYYEGTYSVSMKNGNTTIFSIGFGDSAIFNFGEYEDGYPVRYNLDGISIDEVVGFFEGFEEE